MKKITLMMLAVLLVATGALASNMGFKIVQPELKKAAGGAQDNYRSIAFNNSYTNAGDLFTDIGVATQVIRYDFATNAFQTYDGAFGTNFVLAAGESYIVRVNTDKADWVHVGSHDPTAQVSFKKAAGGAQDNYNGAPFHTTCTNAGCLFTEIGVATQVIRYDFATNAFQTYDGAFGTNFAVTPGEGYIVRVNTDKTDYVPSHF